VRNWHGGFEAVITERSRTHLTPHLLVRSSKWRVGPTAAQRKPIAFLAAASASPSLLFTLPILALALPIGLLFWSLVLFHCTRRGKHTLARHWPASTCAGARSRPAQ